MKNVRCIRKNAGFVNHNHRQLEKGAGRGTQFRSSSHVPTGKLHGRFEGVKLGGRNVGATMMARHGHSSSGALQDCCSINIYINNNVQGVNNSVLVGSQVTQGDPGVRLSFKGLKLGKGFQKTSNKKAGESVQVICWIVLLALIALIFLVSIL